MMVAGPASAVVPSLVPIPKLESRLSLISVTSSLQENARDGGSLGASCSRSEALLPSGWSDPLALSTDRHICARSVLPPHRHRAGIRVIIRAVRSGLPATITLAR